MGDIAELRIPDLGEGVDQGVVIALLVAAGEHVSAGQALLEIETDKVTLEIPSPRDGVVTEFLVAADAVIRPGDAVLRLEADGTQAGGPQDPAATASATPLPTPAPASGQAAPTPARETPAPAPAAASVQTAPGGIIPAGPAARREARQLGVDLARVRGQGPRGRILVADVRAFVRAQMQGKASAQSSPPLPDLTRFGPVRRVALSAIERATARNLSRSAAVVPQAWVSINVDITTLEQARRAARARQAPGDAPLTMTAVLCYHLARLLREFPRFNAAFDADNDEIVYRETVNLGVAVDTERGLLVPVLRDADTLALAAIADQLATLSRKAREKALDAAELRGAGCTVSNLGGLGVHGIQPLVNWPEAAILGVAASREVPAMLDGAVVARVELPLTLGFDHRLINGADAARFLRQLAVRLTEAESGGSIF